MADDAVSGSTTTTRPAHAGHWSKTLPPGNGKPVTAGVWMIPATVAAAIVAGLTIRGWLG